MLKSEPMWLDPRSVVDSWSPPPPVLRAVVYAFRSVPVVPFETGMTVLRPSLPPSRNITMK